MDKLLREHQQKLFEAWLAKLLVSQDDESRAFLIKLVPHLKKQWMKLKPYGG